MNTLVKQTHSQQRAAERYCISDFKPYLALKEILDDNCVQIDESIDKYSRKFLIKYLNKYIIVVTDFQVNHVKTCLPFKEKFYSFLDELISKINNKNLEVVK